MIYVINIVSDGIVYYHGTFESCWRAWEKGRRYMKVLGGELLSHPLIHDDGSMSQGFVKGMFYGTMKVSPYRGEYQPKERMPTIDRVL